MPKSRSTSMPSRGMSLRQALAQARNLGCEVYWPRRTGEVVVRHRLLEHAVRVNARRHDASRELVGLLRALVMLGDATPARVIRAA